MHKIVYLAVRKGNILVNILLLKIFIATALELYKIVIFFPEKEDERIFFLWSGIYVYFS